MGSCRACARTNKKTVDWNCIIHDDKWFCAVYSTEIITNHTDSQTSISLALPFATHRIRSHSVRDCATNTVISIDAHTRTQVMARNIHRFMDLMWLLSLVISTTTYVWPLLTITIAAPIISCIETEWINKSNDKIDVGIKGHILVVLPFCWAVADVCTQIVHGTHTVCLVNRFAREIWFSLSLSVSPARSCSANMHKWVDILFVQHASRVLVFKYTSYRIEF